MRKLKFTKRLAAVLAIVFLLALIGLNSCNNSSDTKETKTDSSKMEKKMMGDSTHPTDTSGKGGQEPPPH